ncbi:MAG: ABC transporter permease [Chromatiaceae bacterium]
MMSEPSGTVLSDARPPERGKRWLDPRVMDLVRYKTYADLRAEAAKTYINYLWWVIDPILSMAVFYLVFSVMLQSGTEGFVAFLLSGLVIWNWYRQSISNAGGAILTGQGLMGQVHVPKLVFPATTLLTDLTKFALVFVLLLVFLWLSGYPVGITYFALPVLLLVQFLLIAAFGCLLAALVPYLPDLRFLVDNLLNLQFFISGVFFMAKDVPPAYHMWFYLNPMAGLIEDFRGLLLHGYWPHWGRLGLVALGASLLLLFAIILIRRFDRDYPRLVP